MNSDIFWGTGFSGGQDPYPIWWNGFGEDPDKSAAYHGLFVGQSGYGKTISMNALLYREAMRGTQVILMETQGHSRRLAELVGEGAIYNPLSLRTMQINPLDPISDDLNEQKSYLLNLCRLMIKQVNPEWRLSMREAGLLDAALNTVYTGLDDPLHTPAVNVPRLEQLCQALKQQGAKQLADEMALNFVTGSMGAVYNRPTNLDMALEAAMVAYDFKNISWENWPLMCTLVLGRIRRMMLLRAGRVRRRVVAIDEFGWMVREPMLETIATWLKTFRAFGCGVWMVERNLWRPTRSLAGHSIINNSVFQLFFHHEPAAAEVVAEIYPDVAPYRKLLSTIQPPQEIGVAEVVLRLPDGIHHFYMLLTDIEQRVLLGS